MKCHFCGKDLPENSEFCLFCGKRQNSIPSPQTPEFTDNETSVVLLEASQEKPIESEYDNTKQYVKKTRYCKFCGEMIETNSNKCKTCGKKASTISAKNLILAICIILLIAAIGLLLFQRFSFMEKILLDTQELSSQNSIIKNLEMDITNKESKIDLLYGQIESLKTQINDYKKDADTLDTIVSFMQSKNAGAASNKFKASDKLFIVDKNDGRTSFTLTCSFSGSTTVYTSKKGSAADIEFSQDSWYGSTTTIFINPKVVGSTIITFSNDQNAEEFRILILVME